jgi:hypothetical protein
MDPDKLPVILSIFGAAGSPVTGLRVLLQKHKSPPK